MVNGISLWLFDVRAVLFLGYLEKNIPKTELPELVGIHCHLKDQFKSRNQLLRWVGLGLVNGQNRDLPLNQFLGSGVQHQEAFLSAVELAQQFALVIPDR